MNKVVTWGCVCRFMKEGKNMAEETKEIDIQMIQNLINSIQYGTISIVVQDGKIVQVDKTEKYRVKN